MVDIAKIKAGDKVAVEMEVLDIACNDIRVGLKHTTFWLKPEHIIGHAPKPRQISVGDEVKIDDYDAHTYKVMAVHEDVAWLWCTVGSFKTSCPIVNLMHVK